MHSSLFYKLFPPPKFMVMKHAGLHISDHALRVIEYTNNSGDSRLKKYAQAQIPEGIIEGGIIKDEKAFAKVLTEFDRAHDLTYVKVSVPEEKSYLFQTEVPSHDIAATAQNIEFKLEENVPLSASDAVFYFDYLPLVPGGPLRASVSVVQRAYIENYIQLMRGAGIYPLAFEVLPKSIARAVIDPTAKGAAMIVHIMSHKTGVYVVSGGVVVFTSTISWGSKTPVDEDGRGVKALTSEVNRIYTYWTSHNTESSPVNRIIMVGKESPRYEDIMRKAVADAGIVVEMGSVWRNVFNLDHYVPPISLADSLDYAAAAGLAMGL